MRVAMKPTIFVIASILVLSVFSVSAQEAGVPSAQGTPPALGAKIAFLNFSLVLEGTEEAKLEISRVRSFMDEKQSAFDTQTQELEQLRQQFAAQERTLNAQTRAEMQSSIADKETELRRFQEDTQREINKRRDGLFARLSNKIQPVMAEYAQKNGLAAILFVDQLQGYFNPELDITQEIIRLYNEQNPVQAGGGDTQ